MTCDVRGNLLDQIRQGIELKRVVPSASSAASKQDVAAQDTLAGALARALAERSRAIHSDSSSVSSEDEEEDDEEWED
jgi:Wiskott-Aldrich syndrome protein